MSNTLEMLKKWSGAGEGWRVEQYELWIGSVPVSVTVQFDGSVYAVTASGPGREEGDEPLSNRGNSDADLDTAIANVHWWIFKYDE